MGSSSFVQTTSNATDNRLAVTDQGLGLSSSGSGNHVNLQITDGGTVNNALSFASGALAGSLQFTQNSLSQMLESVINGQKLQQQTAQYSADTISHAINTATATQAAAAQVAGANPFGKWVQDNGLKLSIGAAAVFAAWYVWGRK